MVRADPLYSANHSLLYEFRRYDWLLWEYLWNLTVRIEAAMQSSSGSVSSIKVLVWVG
jgi:hypothetical protein